MNLLTIQMCFNCVLDIAVKGQKEYVIPHVCFESPPRWMDPEYLQGTPMDHPKGARGSSISSF